MSEPNEVETLWTPWVVVPRSGFEVAGEEGAVGLVQVEASQFLVTESFWFQDPAIKDDLRRHLLKTDRTEAEADAMIREASTFVPTGKGPTDLASVPMFMRWFENTYGNHTLAAILHDELIVGEPNGGALASDTLSDRFFRKMLEAAGVPWLKRWIMWTAVALRTRWAAKGLRRYSLILWALIAVCGVVSFSTGVIWTVAAGGFSAGVWILLGVPLLLPILAAPLWGAQRGASIVAALAGVFVIPAGAFVILGLAIYRLLEAGSKLVRDE